MEQFFKELFEYNYHYNQKLWDVLNDAPGRVSEKALTLYNHILNAHQVWNNRVEPKQITFGVWEMHLSRT